MRMKKKVCGKFRASQSIAFKLFRSIHKNWSTDNLPNIGPERYPVLGEYIPIVDQNFR